MEMTKNAISWFEIPVSDFDRAKDFYQKIFDFEMPEMEIGPLRMGIFLHERDKGIGGAICKGDGYTPAGANGPKVYLNGGTDLDIVLNRVDTAGGKVLMDKTNIGEDYGNIGLFADTEGNVVGIYSGT